MKGRLLAGLIAAALAGGAASAADMRVYQAAAPIISYFSWTGCYVGGNVGGLFATRAWKDQIPGDPFFGTDFGSYTAGGALAGIQGGCNYQLGGWVIGAQADYDWSNASAYNTPPSLFAPLFLTDRSQTKSLASATGRVGYAWDRLLGYVKFGSAWQRSTYSLLVAGQAGRFRQRDARRLDGRDRRRIRLSRLAHRLRRVRLLSLRHQHEHIRLRMRSRRCRRAFQHLDRHPRHQRRHQFQVRALKHVLIGRFTRHARA